MSTFRQLDQIQLVLMSDMFLSDTVEMDMTLLSLVDSAA